MAEGSNASSAEFTGRVFQDSPLSADVAIPKPVFA